MSNLPSRRKSPRADRRTGQLQKDAEAFYETFSALLRTYQFRDREKACYHGLSLNACYGLDLAVRNGSFTVNELATELRVNKSSASRIASHLESEHLLERETHPDDLRSWIFKPTREGRSLNRRIRKEIIDRQATILADVDHATREQLLSVMEELIRSEIRRQCSTEQEKTIRR